MQNVVRLIVQKVNASRNLREALDAVVHLVREAMETEACSIFLLDKHQQEFILMATDGLNPEAVGELRIGVSQGLTGLISGRGETINIADATSHPQYFPVEGVQEERFKAFLGVPIIYHRQPLGVMFVQQTEPRRFDETEEAFLVTASAQLASLIAHAEATQCVEELDNPKEKKVSHDILSGIPSVSGVSVGQALIVYPLANLDAIPDRKTDDIEEEIQRFDTALSSAREDIKILTGRMEEALPPEEQALFDVYLRILDREGFGKEVISLIKSGVWAETALRQIIKEHVLQFEAMDDPYLRERATDINDLGRRVLAHLQLKKRTPIEYPESTILVGEEVPASALAEVPEGCLAGVVSGSGASNSHIAILARAMGIPTVMGVSELRLSQIENKELIVDGYQGHVHIAPPSHVREQLLKLAEEEKELVADLESLQDLPAKTPDDHEIELGINTGFAVDVEPSLTSNNTNVGLFRTELPFMVRDSFPSEEEQRVLYRQLLNVYVPRTVTMRTLDIGGDKTLPYFPIDEANPFLGWRGIRITLDQPELFLAQLRAMLRANHELNNLRIMFPMINSPSEADEAYRLLNKAFDDLREEIPDLERPSVGIMVEVPSAVYLIRQLAKRFDFVSVGSNDLTQYLLAVDRNNARVAGLYDDLHPAMIRALQEIVSGSHEVGKPVSLCGEMAGDPVAVILLLAMKFDSLSINATFLPRIKWVIRNFTLKRAQQLLDDVLQMEDPKAIRKHLETALIEAGLGGLVRAGK